MWYCHKTRNYQVRDVFACLARAGRRRVRGEPRVNKSLTNTRERGIHSHDVGLLLTFLWSNERSVGEREGFSLTNANQKGGQMVVSYTSSPSLSREHCLRNHESIMKMVLLLMSPWCLVTSASILHKICISITVCRWPDGQWSSQRKVRMRLFFQRSGERQRVVRAGRISSRGFVMRSHSSRIIRSIDF